MTTMSSKITQNPHLPGWFGISPPSSVHRFLKNHSLLDIIFPFDWPGHGIMTPASINVKSRENFAWQRFHGWKALPVGVFLEFERCFSLHAARNRRQNPFETRDTNSVKAETIEAEGGISHRILGSFGKSPRNSYISWIFWGNWEGIPFLPTFY